MIIIFCTKAFSTHYAAVVSHSPFVKSGPFVSAVSFSTHFLHARVNGIFIRNINKLITVSWSFLLDATDYGSKVSSPSGYPARPHSYYSNGNNDWNKDGGIHPKSPGTYSKNINRIALVLHPECVRPGSRNTNRFNLFSTPYSGGFEDNGSESGYQCHRYNSRSL